MNTLSLAWRNLLRNRRRSLMTLVAMVLGLGAAAAGEWLFNLLHLSWIPPGRVEQVALSVRLTSENVLMIGSAVALVSIAALSAILPAARAARMNLVDALRHA